MKRMTFIAALIACAVCLSAQAQSWRMKAHIPFGFEANEVVLPAGDYVVSTTAGVLTLQNSEARGKVFIPGALPASKPASVSDGLLLFTKCGDKYFLRNVWAGDYATGYGVKLSKRQAEMVARMGQPEKTFIRAAK